MFWCVVLRYIFTHCLYFDFPYGLVKIQQLVQLVKIYRDTTHQTI